MRKVKVDSSMSTFYGLIDACTRAARSVLCVGLDPDPARIPEGYPATVEGTLAFLGDVILATRDVCAAYKPNAAFFEAMGPGGFDSMREVAKMVRRHAPHAMLIADAKRGDIGNTARMYAKVFFEDMGYDVVTVSPYMGMDTIEPFASFDGKGAFVLCLTSNPGAADFEEQGDPPTYVRVTQAVAALAEDEKLGLVVGATRDPAAIERIRRLAPTVPFLIPGVGEQGGDLEAVINAAGSNVLINVSRSIMYAGKTRGDVPDASRRAALSFADRMRV